MTMNDDDASVLRLWRERCPELRALWSGDADVSAWEGVTFGGEEHGTAGRVVTIVLMGNQLTGEMPPELGQLAALKVLSLANNQLTGEVPAALVALGQLAALEVLSLDGNRLTGAVPAELGQLAALKYLYLRNNQLTSVPAALMQQLRGRDVDVRLDDGVALLY